MAIIAAVALVLLALLVQRVVRGLQRGPMPRRRWVLAVRTVVLALLAVAGSTLVPRVLADARLPAQFGPRSASSATPSTSP